MTLGDETTELDPVAGMLEFVSAYFHRDTCCSIFLSGTWQEQHCCAAPAM
jgi:hypothetical protein